MLKPPTERGQGKSARTLVDKQIDYWPSAVASAVLGLPLPEVCEEGEMSDMRSHSEVEMGSERSFGFVFAAVFTVIAFWPVVFGLGSLRFWALVVAFVFLLLALFVPHVMAPLNRGWFKFGLLLGAVMAPLVMGLIFLLTVVPIGYIRRLKYKDPLNQRFDPDAQSYWVYRSKEVGSSSMYKQY